MSPRLKEHAEKELDVVIVGKYLLGIFKASDEYKTLDATHQALIDRQLEVMAEYRDILEQRLELLT